MSVYECLLYIYIIYIYDSSWFRTCLCREKYMTGTKIVLQRQNAIACSQGDGWIFGNASKRWSQRRWAMSSFHVISPISLQNASKHLKYADEDVSLQFITYHYWTTIWQGFIPPDASGINAHGFVMLALQCHGCKGSDLICFRRLAKRKNYEILWKAVCKRHGQRREKFSRIWWHFWL